MKNLFRLYIDNTNITDIHYLGKTDNMNYRIDELISYSVDFPELTELHVFADNFIDAINKAATLLNNNIH